MCLSFEVSTVAIESFPSLLRFVSSSNGVAYLSISKAPRATRAHFPIVPPTFASPCPPSLYLSISSLRRHSLPHAKRVEEINAAWRLGNVAERLFNCGRKIGAAAPPWSGRQGCKNTADIAVTVR